MPSIKTLVKRNNRLFQASAQSTGFSLARKDERVQQFAPCETDTLAQSAEKRLAFAKCYLPEFVPFPFTEHHHQAMQCLQIRGRLVVIVCPRNFGKGTMALIDNVYDICYGLEPYIVRLEHDAKAAKDEAFKIAHIFTHNMKIMIDFPHVRPRFGSWSPAKGELRFEHGMRFSSLGLLELVRGRTELASRISKVQVNDPVKNAQEARSVTHNNDVYDLMIRSIAKAGGSMQETPISYCMLTTCQAQGDATDLLSRSPMAKVYKLPALLGEPDIIKDLLDTLSQEVPSIRAFCDEIEAEGHNVNYADRQRFFQERQSIFGKFFETIRSYWKERFPLVDLFFDAAADTAAFAQEMLHITGDTAFQKFYHSWFQPYDGTLPPGHYHYGMAIDTSGEPKEGSDPMAIVAGAWHIETGNLYILEVWCDQATPEELVKHAHDIHQRQFKARLGYQLNDEAWESLKRQHPTCPLPQLHPIRDRFFPDKTAFMDALRPLLSTTHGNVFQKEIMELADLSRQASVYLEALVSATGMGRSLFRQTARATGDDPLPVYEIKPTEKKEVRIMAMRPVVEQRRIYLIPGHSQQDLLKTQWCNWRGESTHKKLPIEFKIDCADACTLLYNNITTQSRPPVVLISPPKPPRTTPPSFSLVSPPVV